MSLITFSNTRNQRLSPAFNGVFESVLNDSLISDRSVSKVPAVNISEDKSHYSIDLAAPGLNKEDFKIQLDKNILTVSVARTPEDKTEGRRYTKREFSYHSFSRAFVLPESADNSAIEAEYTQGVLSIRVAKKEQAKPIARQIQIK
ncbi:HSP20 family protein [Arcticibacter pallidicorallinus]|uniref:HSP20 family protein n=1 Tax=Arcticibacter pallidicorallinus TaxID=1259464 RepID=A0A2T0U9N8_9SPHI|nr:Hsp20/alpha crystallin family protein [Arcticibacter pallidicorallinus]PRY54592.1 HSP20 family protein [Arcticibacter pallidicorallinus]